ncbi:alpha/beta hydrolase [uncultured Clostridium sp.]|uniref:alpha/beta hydrolase n=1 Tax=uncultured Clostridium sp. TaxID=59620 RepID=UPI00260EAA89|nr:alpha/beta hydrolase [uncultured Clostridium sp.]
MGRKYSEELLNKIIEKQEVVDMEGLEVLVKNLPDCDVKGAIDPRLYLDMKPQLDMMNLVASGEIEMPQQPGSITELRAAFNGIKSNPMVEENIQIINKEVEAKDGYKIPIRIYKLEKTRDNADILYYIHGGGFFAGSPDVVEELVKLIVEKSDMIAVSVDYRLCPENPYPTGHEDCYTVLKWIYENAEMLKGDKNNIFVAGDSAGGNLTQYCTTRDKEDGLDMVKGQLLLYPTVNMANIEDEFFKWSIDEFQFTPKIEVGMKMSLQSFGELTEMLGKTLGTEDINNKYLSPYGMELEGMPPTFITVGEHDYLKLECLAYGKKLKKANVKVKTVLYKGLGHAYGDNVGVYPQSEDCAYEMIKFIKENKR